MLTDIVIDVVVPLLLDTAYIYSSLLILILQLLFAANTDCIYVGTVMFLDVVCFVVDVLLVDIDFYLCCCECCYCWRCDLLSIVMCLILLVMLWFP